MTPKSREASREAFEKWYDDPFKLPRPEAPIDWTPAKARAWDAWCACEKVARSKALEEAAQACGAIAIKHYLPKDYEQNLLGGGAEECETAIRALKERG